jgi:DNA invertase Pin-like site-specific DNA recombinase
MPPAARGLPRTVRPAVQYLRVSTREQCCSIEAQESAIRAYAHAHGYRIVRSYADVGASGLTLRHRPGLGALLRDVMEGKEEFDAILVYDVSRWGRFQDADESAHYEYVCKNAGKPVHYCFELFTNDGSVESSIAKNLQRAMAAEQSRERSVKCFRGIRHIVELGFRGGGAAPYGFRRAVVVREIFKMALYDHFGVAQIARELRRRRTPHKAGRPWVSWRIDLILRNPVYIGRVIWNKRSAKLGSRRVVNPVNQWVIHEAGCPQIVDPDTYAKVQALLRRRKRAHEWSDERLLQRLRWLLARKKRITQDLINKTPGMPGYSTYFYRFGSIRHAYSKIGYFPAPVRFVRAETEKRSRALRDRLIDSVRGLFPRLSTVGDRPVLRLPGGTTVSIVFGRRTSTLAEPTWRVDPKYGQVSGLTLLCLTDAKCSHIVRMYLLPRRFSRWGRAVHSRDSILHSGIQIPSLSELCVAASRLQSAGRDQPALEG